MVRLTCRCLHLHHRAHCLLPVPLAHALSCNPQLVSAAVHALCDRSLGDVKVVSFSLECVCVCICDDPLPT